MPTYVNHLTTTVTVSDCAAVDNEVVTLSRLHMHLRRVAPRRTIRRMDADVIVVGAGLAGLAATAELADAGRKVLLLDQEGEQSLGGQAFWSFGGLFFVDSPEQRRLRIKDSHALAWQDWLEASAHEYRSWFAPPP